MAEPVFPAVRRCQQDHDTKKVKLMAVSLFRPTYAVVAVASLVQNLHELFPVNVLLAIVLARSLRMASMRQCPAMPT